MNFVLGVMVVMAFLISVNLVMIVLDIEAGNTLDFTKLPATLDFKDSDVSARDVMEPQKTNGSQNFAITVSDDIVIDVADSSEPTNMIRVPAGSGIPGCDDTYECYLPYEITVNAGQTVTWINDDVTIHTVTASDDPTDLDMIGDKYPNGFDSGLLAADATFEHTFEDAGTYPYYCLLHPWMTGVINVESGDAPIE